MFITKNKIKSLIDLTKNLLGTTKNRNGKLEHRFEEITKMQHNNITYNKYKKNMEVFKEK